MEQFLLGKKEIHVHVGKCNFKCLSLSSQERDRISLSLFCYVHGTCLRLLHMKCSLHSPFYLQLNTSGSYFASYDQYVTFKVVSNLKLLNTPVDKTV